MASQKKILLKLIQAESNKDKDTTLGKSWDKQNMSALNFRQVQEDTKVVIKITKMKILIGINIRLTTLFILRDSKKAKKADRLKFVAHDYQNDNDNVRVK